MSCSPHKLKVAGRIRDVRVRNGLEILVSETRMRHALEEQYRAGFESGQKALNEQLVEQRKQLFEIQTGVLASISNALPALIADCEKSLVLLALEAARRVVHETPISAAMIERTVRAALEELRDTAEYTVRLHPKDLEMLKEISSNILPDAENKSVSFVSDDRVAPGGCLVQTRLGSIEATREKMFEKLESAVLC